jgi:hypothetical protein
LTAKSTISREERRYLLANCKENPDYLTAILTIFSSDLIFSEKYYNEFPLFLTANSATLLSALSLSPTNFTTFPLTLTAFSKTPSSPCSLPPQSQTAHNPTLSQPAQTARRFAYQNSRIRGNARSAKQPPGRKNGSAVRRQAGERQIGEIARILAGRGNGVFRGLGLQVKLGINNCFFLLFIWVV